MKIQNSTKKLIPWIFLIALTSCSLIKKPEKEVQIKIVSDYCQVHTKFPNDLSDRVVEYWKITEKSVNLKKTSGVGLTPEEELFDIFKIYTRKNEQKFVEKCDRDVLE